MKSANPTIARLKAALSQQSVRNAAALFLVVAALAWLTGGTFLSPRNLTNLSRQISINGILALGMTYVILIGGIDLSVGSVVALSGIFAGLLQVNGGLAQWGATGLGPGIASVLVTILASVTVGLLCGAFNAWMITRHRIAPFIITLGMMVIARGFALILAHGAAIAPLGDEFGFLGQGYLSQYMSVAVLTAIAIAMGLVAIREKKWNQLVIGFSAILAGAWIFLGYRGIPVPVLLWLLFSFVAWGLLTQTRLGRYVLAIGGNADAAWLAGVPVSRVAATVYLVMGALSGFSGAVLAARLNGALPTAGELFELDAIAAVVMGGTSLTGGIGSIQGSLLGAIFIGILNNGMSLMDVTEFYQKIVKGVIIILAVWLDRRGR